MATAVTFVTQAQADGRRWITYTITTDAGDTLFEQSLQPGNFDPTQGTFLVDMAARYDASLQASEISANVEEVANA